MITQNTATSSFTVRHDGALNISEGASRTSKTWKNKAVNWSELVTRLGNTTRTGESFAEYLGMPKSQRDKIKDVGGYVGGSLKGGRRINEAVQNRQLITLDADFPTGGDLWADYQMIIGAAGLVYSTHSHSAGKPRLRLVIPMSRPVLPDEYQPVSRWVAAKLGIDQFDDTTYEPTRLMYYPSSSRDGEFVFHYLDAPWIDPDYILGTYVDWTDSSYWPESSRRSEIWKRHAEKQGEPTEKPGMVGAFCRSYDVPSAIETFLAETYTELDDTRYTFNGGSTTGGLVLYDNGKFAFSHHGTDPVSGKLVNSFDLVRLHLFGEADQDTSPDTPITRKPSYLKMQEYAATLPVIKNDLIDRRREEALQSFQVITPEMQSVAEPETRAKIIPFESLVHHEQPSENDMDEWAKAKGDLEMNKHGYLVDSIDNAHIILSYDPALKGAFGYNEFTGRVTIRKPLPWRFARDGESWADVDDADLRHYLEKAHKLAHKGNIETAWLSVSRKNTYHPIRKFLGSLEWDGFSRLDTLMVDYLGAEDTEYTRAVTRKSLVAAVARVMTPGIKFDYMLTLVGAQGVGKSSIFQLLAGGWFSDSFNTFQGKEAYEQLRGAWIVEMAELAAARKADVESMKQFITKRVDSYRPAYAHHVQDFDRQNIFVGTTNDYQFLRDKTGNRRFWIIGVGVSKPKYDMWSQLDAYQACQVWAEAKKRYEDGEELILRGELSEEATRIQEAHIEDVPMAGMIAEFLDFKITEDWYELPIIERKRYIQGYTDPAAIYPRGNVTRDRVCALEVWCELLDGSRGKFPKVDSRDINDVLRKIEGWGSPETATGRLRFGAEYGSQSAFLRNQ